MRPEGLTDKVVRKRVVGGVVVGALRRKKSGGLAPKETRKELTRRVFMHSVRREPSIGPCFDET